MLLLNAALSALARLKILPREILVETSPLALSRPTPSSVHPPEARFAHNPSFDL